MYGFPQPLFSTDMLGGQKMFNDTSMMFGLSPDKEIFYSIKDGNWYDATTWQTLSGAIGKLPTVNDDVYIKHTVSNASVSLQGACNNLYVSGIFIATGGANMTFTIAGNLKVDGVLDMSLASVIHYFTLKGNQNYIKNYITGGCFIYAGMNDQDILPIIYNRLTITSDTPLITNGVPTFTTSQYVITANKNLIADIVVLENFSTSAYNQYVTLKTIINLGSYNLTVNGTTQNGATITKTGGGNITFIGAVSMTGTFLLPGNPNVEFRNGLNIQGFPFILNTGTGTWSFTTNNQIFGFNNSYQYTLDCLISIDNINLTIGNGTSIFSLNNTINGTTASSQLINKGYLQFATSASVPSMTTGTWDFTTFANTIAYIGNYTATIPFATFWSLTIGGTGTKTQATGTNTVLGTLAIAASSRLDSGGNTTVSGTTTILSGGSLNLLTYDWTFAIVTQTTSTLSKTGAGSLIFNGLWTLSDAATGFVNFSGNPTVECRGGIGFYGVSTVNFNTGNGAWSFTTNNQNIKFGYYFYPFNNPITIVGAITVILLSPSGQGTMLLNNSFDGTDALSTFDVRGRLYFNNASYPLAMPTFGVFIPTTTSTSIIGWVFNGAYTIPYTNFKGLVIGGTGEKSISGDTTVESLSYPIGSIAALPNGILQLSSYNFTNNGTTQFLSSNGSILKSGAGNVLFVGLVNCASGPSLDFSSGNPNVEFRGGLNTGGYTFTTFKTGTGLWSFTTNTQNFSSYFQVLTFDCNILISGAITLSMGDNGTTSWIVNGTLNGDNIASKFDNRLINAAGIQYKNTIQPMITGLLETNAAANRCKYNLLGAQDVKGGTYRTLEFGGSGVKTLQGNVVVNTTAGGSWTITGTATINYNGFTITTI